MVLQFSHLNDLHGLSVAYSVCNYGHILYRFQDIAIIGRKTHIFHTRLLFTLYGLSEPLNKI